MSNLEVTPRETLCVFQPSTDGIHLLNYREVPLGGPRAMAVRRTLPGRGRTSIGAWCFLDHYGPDDVSATSGMTVPPHPHTGLQTVSWLFQGRIEHRDSTGAHASVVPGELNLMTAGRGVSHSEISLPDARVLHGVQLWLALPESHRHTAPAFQQTLAQKVHRGDAECLIFLGKLADQAMTKTTIDHATTYSPVLGAQLDIPPNGKANLALDAGFEHGVLVDTGSIDLDGTPVPRWQLAYLPPGRIQLRLAAGEAGARLLLLGGEPLGEELVMWWNFIGRDHDEIVEFREQWQHDVIDGGTRSGRFGWVADYPGDPLPAPELPQIRLKPR